MLIQGQTFSRKSWHPGTHHIFFQEIILLQFCGPFDDVRPWGVPTHMVILVLTEKFMTLLQLQRNRIFAKNCNRWKSDVRQQTCCLLTSCSRAAFRLALSVSLMRSRLPTSCRCDNSRQHDSCLGFYTSRQQLGHVIHTYTKKWRSCFSICKWSVSRFLRKFTTWNKFCTTKHRWYKGLDSKLT